MKVTKTPFSTAVSQRVMFRYWTRRAGGPEIEYSGDFPPEATWACDLLSDLYTLLFDANARVSDRVSHLREGNAKVLKSLEDDGHFASAHSICAWRPGVSSLMAVDFYNLIMENDEMRDECESQEGDGQPQDGEGQPQEGDGQPQDGEGQPQEGDGQPQDGEGQPQEGDGQPQEGDGQPQDGEGQPQEGEGQPQDGEGQPQEGDGQPQDGEGQPQEGEGQPQGGKQAGKEDGGSPSLVDVPRWDGTYNAQSFKEAVNSLRAKTRKATTRLSALGDVDTKNLPQGEVVQMLEEMELPKMGELMKMIGEAATIVESFVMANRRVESGYEISGVEPSGDISRLSPSSLGALSGMMGAGMQAIEAVNFANGDSQSWVLTQPVTTYGDLYTLIDESSSMEGYASRVAKAILGGLIAQAVKDGRKYDVGKFNARPVFMSDEKSPLEIAKFLKEFMGGGTSFNRALDGLQKRVIDDHGENGDINADVIILTDGEDSVSSDTREAWSALKARGMKVYIFFVYESEGGWASAPYDFDLDPAGFRGIADAYSNIDVSGDWRLDLEKMAEWTIV